MNYKEIRKYQTTELTTEFLICPYCQLFSPFFTMYFLKHSIIPNVITVYMILSGVIGAFFFAIPNLFCQIIGAIFIHVWFILDCSDGEVARITGRFSTFGKEIDYTAHVVNHPLFGCSFFAAMYFSGLYNMKLVLLSLCILLVLDGWSRHLCSFEDIWSLKMNPKKEKDSSPVVSRFTAWKVFIRNSLLVFPNFALLFPLFFFIDMLFHTSSAFWLLILYTLTNFWYIPRLIYGWIRRIVHEK